MNDTLNKKKFSEWLDSIVLWGETNYDAGFLAAVCKVKQEINSGRFDASPSEGRYREALERIAGIFINMEPNSNAAWAKISDVLREALTTSPSGEERGGTKQIKEMYDLYKGAPYEEIHGEYQRGVEDTLKFLGITIPGINSGEETK